MSRSEGALTVTHQPRGGIGSGSWTETATGPREAVEAWAAEKRRSIAQSAELLARGAHVVVSQGCATFTAYGLD